MNHSRIRCRIATQIVQIAILLGFGLLCGCSTLVKSIDHSEGRWEKSYPNAFLWRRVNSDPAVFHPKALPADAPIEPETGDWVVDPQDRAAFFVPNRECGGLSPELWLAEAKKAVNDLSKGDQFLRNSAIVLVGWPAYMALMTPFAFAT